MKKNSSFKLKSGNKPSPAKLFGIGEYFRKRKRRKQVEKLEEEEEKQREQHRQDDLVRSRNRSYTQPNV